MRKIHFSQVAKFRGYSCFNDFQWLKYIQIENHTIYLVLLSGYRPAVKLSSYDANDTDGNNFRWPLIMFGPRKPTTVLCCLQWRGWGRGLAPPRTGSPAWGLSSSWRAAWRGRSWTCAGWWTRCSWSKTSGGSSVLILYIESMIKYY